MEIEEILESLSTSHGRRDQEPNKALAAILIQNPGSLEKLASLLQHEDSKVVNDTLHTFGFIGESHPELVTPFMPLIIPMLKSANNRSVWAAMITLASIAEGNEEALYSCLTDILDAMQCGSVIARDHGIRILVALYADDRYRDDSFALFCEQLSIAPHNQLGQYAERIQPVIHDAHIPEVIDVLEDRQNDLVHASHQKRIAKIIKQLRLRLK